MSAPSKSTFRDTLQVLGPGPFRRYMIGETISVTGTWMQVMAQSWVMTTLTSSAFMLAMVNFASGVPMLLLSMTGGTAADRHDKRLILMVAQVVQIVLAVVVGLLIMNHAIAYWHLLVVAVLLGVVNAFEMPAASAMVPELVSKQQIKDAIAVDRSIFHATRLLGPAVAGAAISAWGAAIAFFVNAGSFLALMVSLWTLPQRPAATPEEEEARSGGIKDGLDFVRQDQATMSMIGIMAANTLFVSPIMMVLLPLYATQSLHLDAGGMGIMMAVTGIGSLTGSIGLLGLHPDKRLKRLTVAVVGIAASMGALAFAHGLLMAAGALVLLSVCVSTLFGISNTIVQERAPDHLRGRVSAIAGLSFFGLLPFSGLLVSAFADAVGMRQAVGVAAIAFGLSAGALLLNAGRRSEQAVLAEPRAEEALSAEQA